MEEYRRWETGEALPESYNAKESPIDMQKGKLLPTSSGVKIDSLGWLSEESMNFNVTATFTVAWTDPRLANLGGRTWIPVPAHVLWLPAVKFGKTVRASWYVVSRSSEGDGISDEDGTMTTWLSPDGQISHSIRRKLSVSCLLDLRSYPFDKQTCRLQLHGFGGIVFRISPVPGGRKPLVLDLTEADSQFVVRETELLGTVASTRQDGVGCTYFRQKCMMGDSAELCPYLRFCDPRDPACKTCSQFSGTCTDVPMDCNLTKFGGSPDVYSSIEVRFHFKRRLPYYVLQTFIPTTTVVVVSWSSFWIHYSESSARITIGSTTLLMLIRLGSQTMRMPHISYIRAIDVWHIGCLVFALLVTLEFAVVHFLHSNDGEKAKKKQPWNTLARKRSRIEPLQFIEERVSEDETAATKNAKKGEFSTADDNARPADCKSSARAPKVPTMRPVRPPTITACQQSKNHILAGRRKLSSTVYNARKSRSVGPAPTSSAEKSTKQISTADRKVSARRSNDNEIRSAGPSETPSKTATKKTHTADQSAVVRRRGRKVSDQEPKDGEASSLSGDRPETAQRRKSIITRLGAKENPKGTPCSIDIRSRQVFPFCFLLFALTYWLYYAGV
ncbi:uncharacterized protein LOC144886085 [Branchiostoma floridae x Branchiostoma japonicum]